MTREHARWESAVAVIAQVVGTVALVTLMLQVSVNGIVRRLVGVQIPLTLELTEWWYMPLLAAAGIALAALWGEHFYVDLVFERLATSGRRVLAMFSGLVTLVLTVAITWFSLQRALDEAAIGRYEPVTRLPTWPLYFIIPFAFAVFSAILVASLIRLFRGDVRELGVEPSDEEAREAAL